jgi:molybdate transport system ATP-binding protein
MSQELTARFELIRDRQKYRVGFICKPGIGVLMGPSGCGKTTVFDCIAGLNNPTSGTIKFGPHLFFDSETRVVMPPQKRRIGYVLQRPSLFPHMSVRDNILYAMQNTLHREMNSRLTELAESFGVGQLLTQRPHQISGGQAQRVALVRAIAAKPDLFLLDEPFSNLDDKGRNEMIEAIKELRRVTHKPILYITHSGTEASELADYRITVSGSEFLIE